MSLCFVPLTSARLADWVGDGVLSGGVPAYAATQTMVEAFGFPSATDEDAEYTALCVASVACLVADSPRLVAVIESATQPMAADQDFGAVTVSDVPWSQVTALFADEPGLDAVDRVRCAVSGKPLAAAWEDPQVELLLAEADLLWHGPGEWRGLVRG